ncbi:MAG: Asp-tRNA(Asn)/Glu-tRNA(Gln) amidotransferase subunit GatC [bacterium]|nr:Asp-tRNA(Asn)/Glu-tRNA(Gln) amidotransferase subunit GatC [bacterium]
MRIVIRDIRENLCIGVGLMITKKDVHHIAELARISLTSAEEEKYEKELSLTLHFVDKLAEVNTDETAPLTGGTDLVNITRDDNEEKQEAEDTAELLKAAPEHERGYIKVKKVFE